MPYKHRKVGNKYCVYKKDGGEKVGCTKGSKEALRKYLAALHIAEDELEIRQESVGNFKTFFEETEIESLEALIANPDPERVKMYGGTGYVDMLKKKLERVKKAQAIQSHLKQSPLGKGIEDNEDASKAIRSAVNKSEAIKIAQMFDEYMRKGDSKKAKEVMFSIYDYDPEAYKHLYKIYKTQYPTDEDNEALERLIKQEHPAMQAIKDKDIDSQFSPGVKSTLASVYDKVIHSGKDRDDEEDAQDRCKRKADQVYGKKTSAYKSGAIVRCRSGKIWKKK